MKDLITKLSIVKKWTVFLLQIGTITLCFAQDSLITVTSYADSIRQIQIKVPPAAALQKIELLDFKDREIKNILRALGTQFNLNIFVNDAIQQRMTIRLTNITVHDAISYIVKKSGLEMILKNGIYEISLPEIPMPEPKSPVVFFEDDLLTVDFKNDNLEKCVHVIAEKSGKNIILNRGLSGKITGYLQNVPFKQGLFTLMQSNGYVVRVKDQIFVIDREGYSSLEGNKRTAKTFWIDVRDSLITLDVVDADLGEIVRELALQLGLDIFVLSEISGKVNAQCTSVPFESVLNYLFKGTNFTYRRDGGIYLIGDKSVSGIASTDFIRLNHIKVEGITDLLPPSIKSKAVLQVVKEHNGLMVVGSQDVIREVKNFILKIDYPIPQILIEAIVVDFQTTDTEEWGLEAWLKPGGADSTSTGDHLFPDVDITLSSDNINRSLHYYGPKFGINNIGKLPDNFMMNLRALESEGKANIRSQPQISTLNGHPASIKIGTTQYYQLESYTPYPGGLNEPYVQTSQRFEKITAEISLTITPWVSAAGEITTEIKPEFSTPRGFDPKVPPTIDHRILESTIRLRDGETIVLGGLIKTDESDYTAKFPILGDIPIMGKLFQNRRRKLVKSKLMIYITPHLTYTDEFINQQRID